MGKSFLFLYVILHLIPILLVFKKVHEIIFKIFIRIIWYLILGPFFRVLLTVWTSLSIYLHTNISNRSFIFPLTALNFEVMQILPWILATLFKRLQSYHTFYQWSGKFHCYLNRHNRKTRIRLVKNLLKTPHKKPLMV